MTMDRKRQDDADYIGDLERALLECVTVLKRVKHFSTYPLQDVEAAIAIADPLLAGASQSAKAGVKDV